MYYSILYNTSTPSSFEPYLKKQGSEMSFSWVVVPLLSRRNGRPTHLQSGMTWTEPRRTPGRMWAKVIRPLAQCCKIMRDNNRKGERNNIFNMSNIHDTSLIISKISRQRDRNTSKIGNGSNE
jgi:hypothetical protein